MMAPSKRHHWLVRMHYRMRVISFALLFIAACLQSAYQGYSPWVWAFMALVLLLYPHLQFWRACRSAEPLRTEMNNLLIDSLVLGAFIGAMEFSPWLAFSAAMGTLTNCANNKGWRSVPLTLLGLLAGSLAWVLVNGFRFTPVSEWSTSLFCMLGLAGYIIAIGHFGYVRNMQLRATREELKQSEQDLLSANQVLNNNFIEIDKLHQRLHDQANRDPLTGLYNRRYLDVMLDHELVHCQREGLPLSIIMGDLDHFKQINDTYGHQAGDAILIRLSNILRNLARTDDVACRYGGEEFLLMMPGMALETAEKRAQELRELLAEALVSFGDFHIQTTISIGVATYPDHGTSARDLINAADHALYQAKHAGRDRVVVHLVK